MRTAAAAVVFLLTMAPLQANETIPCILINGTAYLHASYLCGASRLRLDALRIIHHEPFISVRSLAGQRDEAWNQWRLDTAGPAHLLVTGNCGGNHARHEYQFRLYQAREYWRCGELMEQRPWLVAWAHTSPAPHVNSVPAWPLTDEAAGEILAALLTCDNMGDPSGGWTITELAFPGIRSQMYSFLGIPDPRKNARTGTDQSHASASWGPFSGARGGMMDWDEAVRQGLLSPQEARQMQRAPDQLWGPSPQDPRFRTYWQQQSRGWLPWWQR